LERELVGWYENLLREILPMLTAESETVIRELVNLPEDIRGYEDLKVHSAAKARELAQSLMMSLHELMASRQAAE
jgi:indolepyruvate ferredoxin oxidoreductase